VVHDQREHHRQRRRTDARQPIIKPTAALGMAIEGTAAERTVVARTDAARAVTRWVVAGLVTTQATITGRTIVRQAGGEGHDPSVLSAGRAR
jgi:hypothetical protein